MKLYNNSQKTPQSESLHKVKRNRKTPRQKKMKVYTAKITGGGSVAASDMAGKNTPKTVPREYRENFHAQKHSSRQSIYTKATRIFLQHPILILYTALFVENGVTTENPVTQRVVVVVVVLPEENLVIIHAGQCEREEHDAAGKWLLTIRWAVQRCPSPNHLLRVLILCSGRIDPTVRPEESSGPLSQSFV